MSKVILNDIVNLQNETSVVNTINANSAVIETAFDNTISRDGTNPNQMNASLDMNSNRILNLPAPSSDNEPLRKIDGITAGIQGPVGPQGPAGSVGGNILNNSGLGLTTNISTVLVGTTPGTPIPVSSFVTVNGSGSNCAGFLTTGAYGPLGNGGLTPGKLVAILGANTAPISCTATVTSGTIITATASVFTQSQGDLIWITGGTNTAPRTQYVVVSVTGGGTVLTINGLIPNDVSKTFIMTAIQGGYSVDATVNGMPQAGNSIAPAFYYYPVQVTAVGTNVFNAQLAGHNRNASGSSTATAWEVTNGVQGTGNTIGPDWWGTSGSLSWYKMRGYDWDGITVVNKPGSLYSVKIVKGVTGAEYFYYDLTANNPGRSSTAILTNLLGRTVTMGAYIWCPNASQGRLYIDDGVTKTYSSYVTPGSYVWVEVTKTLSTSATKAEVGFSLDTGLIGDRFFFTQPMAVLSAGPIGEGNYKPAPVGFKMFYGHTNPFYWVGRNLPTGSYINIETATCGCIPTGMSAIQSDLEAYNNSALSYIVLTNNASQQMTALTLYNQVTSGSVKNVNTMMVGVGTIPAGDGLGFVNIDTHYLYAGDTNFYVNVDYLGGIYS